MENTVLFWNIVKISFGLLLFIPLYLSWLNKKEIGYMPLFFLTLFTISYNFANVLVNFNLSHTISLYGELLTRPLGVGIVLSSVYLTIEYTNSKLNKKDTVYILFAYLIFCSLLFLTNSYHSLLYTEFVSGVDGYLVPVETNLLFLVYILPTSILVVSSIFIIYRYSILHQVSRFQSTIIGVGLIIGYISISIEHVMYTFHQAIDVDVIGICIGVGMISFSVIYYDTINNVPISTSDIMNNIDEIIIAVTVSNSISDIKSNKDFFLDINKSNIGDSVEEVFSEYGIDIAEIIENESTSIEEIQIDKNTLQYYSISSYKVNRNINVLIENEECLGHVIVLKNITDKRNNEEKIKLLKDIFGRVLRHNIRNELNVIQGNTNIIEEEYSETNLNRNFKSIDSSISDLLKISKKARLAEKVIGNIDDKKEFRTDHIIKDAIIHVKKNHKSVDLEYDLESSFTFTAHSRFKHIIREIIDNGVEHNKSEVKKLKIKSIVKNSKKQIIIRDNGSGIEESELKPIFNTNKETPLEHGSGLGLWLIKFIINISGGEITFNRMDTGTEVKIVL